MSGIIRSLNRSIRPRATWMGGGVSGGGVSYRAAEQNRLLKDWVWRYVSADQEIWFDLLQLRGRARELTRNTAWGTNYLRVVRNNAIGPLGIRLQMQIRNSSTDVLNESLNDRIEDAWEEWSEPETCTVDGRLSWLGVQGVMGTNLPMDGELLIKIIRGFPNKFGFALQLLDPDQLDHLYILPPAEGSNEVRSGVEVDQWNRPVAYHIWRGHPADPYAVRIRDRIPAEDIIHVFDPYRVAQTRGVPWLAPVMINLNMLRGYFEAELVAARIAAAKGGFFERKADDGGPGMSLDSVSSETLSMEVEPGLFEELPAGLSFKEWAPEHPTNAFNDFVRSQLRAIAAGGGISATSLSKDLADVNYSSIRAGLLDEREEAKRVQQLLIIHAHRRIFREWSKMGRLAGILDARVGPSSYRSAVKWRPRGWQWVDPKNDAEADVVAVQNGMNSRTNIMAENGLDFEEVIEELSYEQKLAKKLNVEITGAAKVTARPPTEKEGVTPQNENPTQSANGRHRRRFVFEEE